MEIDEERLRADILENAAFGELDVEEGHGRTVLTGSEADRHARERLIERLEAAGLRPAVDPVGNVVGRWTPDGVDDGAPAVVMGSHLDSVPRGGIFDGPLGVYGALEAVRAIRESNRSPDRPLAVVSFTEEEGARFGVGTLGSSVATGARSVADALALADDDGITLADHLDAIGFAGEADLDPSSWDAFLELHVEQGTRLESAGAAVGVVDEITGITNCAVEVRGEADHAGATPMAGRSDALVAAADFVAAVEKRTTAVAADRPTAVATVGQHTVEPNVRNIVPGRVAMEMDVRDVDHGIVDDLVESFRASLDRIEQSRPVETSFDRFRDDAPSHLSARCVAAANDAADAAGVASRRMHSAAMHDTAQVNDATEAGLLFAPSRDGASHSPREWTDWADCAATTRVLAGTALRLATDDADDG